MEPPPPPPPPLGFGILGGGGGRGIITDGFLLSVACRRRKRSSLEWGEGARERERGEGRDSSAGIKTSYIHARDFFVSLSCFLGIGRSGRRESPRSWLVVGNALSLTDCLYPAQATRWKNNEHLWTIGPEGVHPAAAPSLWSVAGARPDAYRNRLREGNQGTDQRCIQSKVAERPQT